jgi:hypothetical protein
VECIAQGGSVRGNVEVNNNSNGSGGPGADVEFIVVSGNVQVNNNSTSFVVQNQVVGNVQVDNNSAGSGGNNFVSGNTIGGNLQCAGNTPSVSDEDPNLVTGTKQGQCAGL